MTLEEQVRRGEQARLLLESQVLTEIFVQIETEALENIKHSKPEESSRRESMYNYMLAAGRVKDILVATADAGRLAVDRIHEAEITDRARKANGLAPGDVP